jgi:hypothetical protein
MTSIRMHGGAGLVPARQELAKKKMPARQSGGRVDANTGRDSKATT